MILLRERIRLVLRAGVLGAVAVAGLTACTRSEITEQNCVPVAEEQLETPSDETAGTQVCEQQRVRLVIRDEFFEEEVVSNKTW